MNYSNIKTFKIGGYEFSNFDDYVKEECKDPKFKKGFDKELQKLRLAGSVREKRQKKGYTQKNFAEKVGMSQSVIARIESGKRNITMGTLSRIASALGLRVDLVEEKSTTG